jgi:hypothetical protein
VLPDHDLAGAGAEHAALDDAHARPQLQPDVAEVPRTVTLLGLPLLRLGRLISTTGSLH